MFDRYLLVSLAVMALFSCSRAPLKPDMTGSSPEIPSTGVAATPVAPGPPVAVSDAKADVKLTAKPLTSTGENTSARFSPDGTRIVFVSRGRPTHKQAQIYELHLGRMTEKRITFHDGDDETPTYAPDGLKVVFASTTDEIKEEPFAVEHMMKTYANEAFEKSSRLKAYRDLTVDGYELYEQTLNARTIERLTQSPGFDADPDVESKGKRIAFASTRDGSGTHIYVLGTGKASTRVSDGAVIDRGPRYSPDGQALVWSRQIPAGAGKPLPTKAEPAKDSAKVAGPNAGETSQLILATASFRKQKVLIAGGGLNLQPAWSPQNQQILFSSNRGGGAFNLFMIDAAGTCLKRLTTADFDQTQPVFSPDGKRILFTGTRGGHRHVYVMDFAAPADCTPLGLPPAPVTSAESATSVTAEATPASPRAKPSPTSGSGASSGPAPGPPAAPSTKPTAR